MSLPAISPAAAFPFAACPRHICIRKLSRAEEADAVRRPGLMSVQPFRTSTSVLPSRAGDGETFTGPATRDYLLAFEEELSKAADGAALTEALVARYPDNGMLIAAQIGAKVAKGEMKWG